MTLKDSLMLLLQQALTKVEQQSPTPHAPIVCQIERTKEDKNGDFASNVALVSAKPLGLKPRDLAQQIVDALPASDLIDRVEIAGPGFINFFVSATAFQRLVSDVLLAGTDYGNLSTGRGKRVHIEYVSSNPTGPLHVGHGRGAAYGSCVVRLLKKAGYTTHAEYYVNDIGRQMKILALSVWVRYLQLLDEKIALPEGAYQGDYVIDIAKTLLEQHHHRFYQSADKIQALLAKSESTDTDKTLDHAVDSARILLGANDFEAIHQLSLDAILADIRQDLDEFGVDYDRWFHESELLHQNKIGDGVKLLAEHGFVYEKEGATWFRATELGDEKDRVLIRANGQPTYFASDVAYHLHKYQQNFDEIIDIFGADHHGYVPRIRAFLKGLGQDPYKLSVLIVQFAILYRGEEKVSMSTRGGNFVTLRELRNEVGNDAARFFYVMRRPDQHLDFDLELAKSQTLDNPVFYIQYAHARICSVWRQLDQLNQPFEKMLGVANLDLLANSHEIQLLKDIERFAEMIEDAATHHAPHLLTHYCQELANHFHSYYNACKFIVEDNNLRQARLCLILAVQCLLKIGLALLGVSAPEAM